MERRDRITLIFLSLFFVFEVRLKGAPNKNPGP
jgi:hypothetical protein